MLQFLILSFFTWRGLRSLLSSLSRLLNYLLSWIWPGLFLDSLFVTLIPPPGIGLGMAGEEVDVVEATCQNRVKPMTVGEIGSSREQGSDDGVDPLSLSVGARLQLFWSAWLKRGAEPWVVQVLKEGYQIPFNSYPPLSAVPQEYPSYLGNKEKFLALESEVKEMLEKGAIEPVEDAIPGFYNRLFLVKKASGAWRPVLDVSRLNRYVTKTKFSMETTQSVLSSIRQGDWMISVDMKDAYFHIPVHPRSRKFLRFVFNNQTYQFRALCFGLSTAPQVFTRVLAPLAKFVHLAGIRIILYLDDWLILARY